MSITITENARILVVDDDPINIRNAVRILKDEYSVLYATGGKKALEIVEKEVPDLVLLDLHMPEMNGFEVLEVLKNNPAYVDIPVIFLTADSNQETEVTGLKAGAVDFIAKPFKDEIVKQRVRNALELHILQNNLKDQVTKLTAKAEERRRQIEEMSFQTVQALAGAIDAKDRYTKGHSTRVSEYAARLAELLGWEKEKIERLRYAALLHDVGKIGVPDSILNKRGKLSDVEFGVIKSHTTVGFDMLSNITTVLDAVDIARHHHERFDGRGYPDGLSGEDISDMARVVCIADSFDAMSSKRIYRNALPDEVIREELVKGRGTQFDPDYLDAFLVLFDQKQLVRQEEMDDKSMNDNAQIIMKVIESAYDSGTNNQVDSLTGLPLRLPGENNIKDKMLENEGALILVDLDNLKKINDIFGHKYGDEVLKALSNIMKNLENLQGLCRIGGDEFLMYIGSSKSEDIDSVLGRLYSEFDVVKASNDCFKYNSLSCGVTLTTPLSVFEDSYSEADKALYFAKRNGKGNYHFYEREEVNSDKLQSTDLDSLISSFSTAGSYEGAMQVDYREFAHMFEYVKNMQKRYDYNVHLVMITMELGDKYSLPIDLIGEAVTAMEKAIKSTIRTVDICTMFSSMQFLVILMGSKDEEVSSIIDRIFSSYYKMFSDRRIDVTYCSALIDEK